MLLHGWTNFFILAPVAQGRHLSREGSRRFNPLDEAQGIPFDRFQLFPGFRDLNFLVESQVMPNQGNALGFGPAVPDRDFI